VIVEIILGCALIPLPYLPTLGTTSSTVIGLILAWAAIKLALHPPTTRFTYGLRGTTILASLANSVLLLLANRRHCLDAIGRITNPPAVQGALVMYVAFAGIVVNGGSAMLFLSGRHDDLNARAASCICLAMPPLQSR